MIYVTWATLIGCWLLLGVGAYKGALWFKKQYKTTRQIARGTRGLNALSILFVFEVVIATGCFARVTWMLYNGL